MSLKSKYDIFKRFNFESIYNTFLGLRPKEQMIALVIAGFALIMVIILPISLASSKISSLEKSISTGREKINDVAREIDDYNRVRSKLSAVETLLKSGFDTSISSTIENIATQSGVKENVDAIKERAVVPSDLFDEASVDVRISKIGLNQLVDFIYKIEGEKTRVLRVKQLQVKPRFDNKKLLDVNMQVATFKLSGEGA